MSNYKSYTQHPYTKEFEMATWLDDHYGAHQYGVRFPNGDTFKPNDLEVKSFDERMYDAYCEWFKENEPQEGTRPGDKYTDEAYADLGRLYIALRESYNF
jgi:hypothetical protein